MNRKIEKKLWDVVIIGGGPAGMTAGIYAGRAMLKCVIVEAQVPGGKMAETDEIENYSGFSIVKGIDISIKMQEHAEHFGCKFNFEKVVQIRNESEKVKIVELSNGTSLQTKAIIIASGTKFRKLEIPGEKKYFSHGVSTCAVCDGALYKKQKVAVIGAGNSATEEGLYLTKFVAKVYLIHRNEKFRASIPNVVKVKNHQKIDLILNTVVTEIEGTDGKVTDILLKNTITKKTSKIAVACVFPYIGQIPNTHFLTKFRMQKQLLSNGFVNVINDKFATCIPGIFAAGDVVNKSLRQVGNAVGEGTNAGQAAVNYVDDCE